MCVCVLNQKRENISTSFKDISLIFDLKQSAMKKNASASKRKRGGQDETKNRTEIERDCRGKEEEALRKEPPLTRLTKRKREEEPLWKLVTDYPDVFQYNILSRLNGTDLKFFNEVNTEARRAIKRAKIELQKKSKVVEMSSVSTLEFAFEKRPKDSAVCEKEFCMRVAKTGKLEFLKWAREVKNCYWDGWTSYVVILVGSMEMLKYCVENGCPLDKWACVTAAQYGHLEILKYLRANNVPWEASTLRTARKHNKHEILRYAIENKCPGWERYVV